MHIAFPLVALIATVAALPNPLKPNPNGESYAVLVAGSNTWGNYRHQSDVCHAYQVLVEHGFNKDNIIVFMYDDLAKNPSNPTPGIIINHPNGKDVYGGVKIDYRTTDVTPENFINVLKGNASAMKGIGSGRVLTSTAADNVFINFVDHGGPGIIAFPSEMLYADTLIAALNYMHTQQMYNQLVFYLEACESGSMFDGLLPANINVFATTASDPTSSSYACYFDQKRGTYLGDVYSVNWMENSDATPLTTQTLLEQYNIVKKLTNTSVVCKYGTMSMGSDECSQFLGDGSMVSRAVEDPVDPVDDAISSRDVDVGILMHKISGAATDDERVHHEQALKALLSFRAQIRKKYLAIATQADGAKNAPLHMKAQAVPKAAFGCYKEAVQTFHESCYNYGQVSYAMEFTKSFASMCESGVATTAIVNAIKMTCVGKAASVIA